MASKKDTIEELNAKLRFIVGVCLAFTLTGTIFAVLYSLIHATQPMFVSPNDQKFFELIQPIRASTGNFVNEFVARQRRRLRIR